MPQTPRSASASHLGLNSRARCGRHWPALAVAALLALAGCAVPPTLPALPPLPHMPLINPAPVVPPEPLVLGAETHGARWFFPNAEARALVLLQPELGRPCERLRGLVQAWQAQGLAVLCLELPVPPEGNGVQREAQHYRVADALGVALAGGLTGPGGRVLPERLVVAGHGLGGAFAARLAARLDSTAPQRLGGVLLLDPLAAPGFSDHLRVVSRRGQRPVLALMAERSDCNARHSAWPALQQLHREATADGQAAYLGLVFGEGSTHLDAEGHGHDVPGHLACGRPQDGPVARLRTLAVQAALAMAAGEAPQPPQGEAAAGLQVLR
jgi:pimeloyl-ACP methyl ester carboxylesterase